MTDKHSVDAVLIVFLIISRPTG